jgi:hypothetical protein
MRLIVFALLAAASFSAAADSLDLNLSNDTVEGRYASTLGFGEWTFGGLYNRDEKNSSANIGLLATGETRVKGSKLEGGVGGKFYVASADDNELSALALGGQMRLYFGDGPFAVSGYVFYAPSVVTFLDGERFWEVGIRAEVELIKGSFVYIGLRQVRAEFENNAKADIDKGGFAGLQIRF